MTQSNILFLVKRFCTLLEGKKLRVWSGLKYFLMRLYICTKVCFKTRIQQNQETGFANNERVRDGIKYYCQGLLRSARIKINQWSGSCGLALVMGNSFLASDWPMLVT